MYSRSAGFLATLAAATCLIGCASVTVKDERTAPTREPSRAPERIYVANFTAEDQDFQVSPDQRKTPTEAAAQTSDHLAQTLVKRLNKYVIPASRIGENQIPPSGWLVRGRFGTVRSGSVPLRILIGMGSGRSTMTTTVSVYDLSKREAAIRPFLSFQTTGGSGAEPGLVTIPLTGPVGLPMLIYKIGSKTYSEAKKGVNDDADRTSRMIAAALSEYLARHGYIPQGSALKAKRDWTSSFTVPDNPLRN